MLTATCLSYGSLCDFIFFPNRPGGHTYPSTDFDAKWLKRRGFTHRCAFWNKNRNFLKPLTPRHPKPPKFAQFWSGLRKFSLHFAFNIGVSRANTPHSSSEPNKSVIVNRRCGGEKFKYVPKFYIGGTSHVISRMRNDDLHWTGSLEPNISKTLGDRDLVPMGHQ